MDLASKGIRVNSINPAVIQTSSAKGEIDKISAEYAKKYPLSRVGNSDDTSHAIAFLASDAASFLTGVLLPVDGGAMVAGV